MKLFVTGGAGFIGSNFIRYWINHNPADLIVNFDKLTYAGNLENLKDLANHSNYTFVRGDITDALAVEQAMDGVDIVIHFAAESHVDRSITTPRIFVETNVLGTQVILEQSLRKRIKRFHQISTDEVYGALELDDHKKFNESASYNPHSPYAASKAAADHLVRAYYHTYGLPITITNCSNNFGPYQFPEKFIPLTITNAQNDQPIPVYGDGQYVRDWLYVEDHVRAIEVVLKKGKEGETYCVGGQTKSISNLDVIKKILKLLGKSEQLITFVKDRPGHDRRYAVNWQKIANEFGWQPSHDFETALTKTINWYKENQEWVRHVKSGEYEVYYKKQYG